MPHCSVSCDSRLTKQRIDKFSSLPNSSLNTTRRDCTALRHAPDPQLQRRLQPRVRAHAAARLAASTAAQAKSRHARYRTQFPKTLAVTLHAATRRIRRCSCQQAAGGRPPRPAARPRPSPSCSACWLAAPEFDGKRPCLIGEWLRLIEERPCLIGKRPCLIGECPCLIGERPCLIGATLNRLLWKAPQTSR